MLSRVPPAILAFAFSVLLLTGLLGALYWTPAGPVQPLEIYCAEAMRLPIEAVAREYEHEFGQKVIPHFGPSQTLLVNLERFGQPVDLFLPADDSYVRQAKRKGLVTDVINLAQMNAVVVVRPGCPRTIATWDEFIAKENKIGLANPEVAAISKLVKEHLQGLGLWDALEARKPNYLGNVNEVGNSIANVGSNDVGIVWDITAQPLLSARPELKIVRLKELEGAHGHVQIAVTKTTQQSGNALRFVRFLRAKDKGAVHLKAQGFSNIEEEDVMVNRPELIVHAGSMLRPALEQSLDEFERREGIRILRKYNGCGILVAGMKTGDIPDLYFSCDTRFMDQVQDQFKPAINVSINQLVITVKKGNPKKVFALTDLAQPGLRVGVGNEQQCALGTLTKETFIRTGLYAKVMKNVVMQSPTGDFLINQLRTGSLDVVVAYRSNVTPFASELEGIPISVEESPCAAPHQPVAISKNTAYPELSRKLMDYLRSEQSRQRFENLGFGWEVKEVESAKK
jgi:molybdenum ABC transporter molybdate-binding protein